MNHWFLHWNFSVATCTLLLIFFLGYARLNRFRLTRKHVYFALAWLLLAAVMISPLRWWGSHYRFSIHMVNHMLLLLLIPSLLVLSIPASFQMGRLLRSIYRYPALPWLFYMGVMWGWHIPAVHRSMHLHAWLYYVQVISLLTAGFLFAWPVLNPFPKSRIHSLTGVLYLASACVGCSLLGLLLLNAPPVWFQPLLHGGNSAKKIVQPNLATDQQIAGLIMWVPCCAIYVSGALYLLTRWWTEREVHTTDIANSI